MSTIPKGPHKTLSEWLRLVTEARQSGLTDCEWCRRNGISVHTFNNAIRRLKAKACQIPAHSCNSGVIDLTTAAPCVPDVVKIDILPEHSLQQIPDTMEISNAQETAPSIEVILPGASIRISNTASPVLVEHLISALGKCSC